MESYNMVIQMENKIELKTLFEGLQEQMIASLKAQEFITHPGTKGAVTENNWLKWMKSFLPQRYAADRAFVIDCQGNVSDQIDIVIYDKQYSPIIFNQDDALYITAESVYAVFEVKQVLNSENVAYASEKIESVRRLQRTSAPVVYSTGTNPPKKLFDIIGGLLTTRTNWIEPIDDRLRSNLKKSSYDRNRHIDLICCIQDASYRVDYYDDEMVSLSPSKKDEVLIYMFLELLLMLQQRGTVPAINLGFYANAIDSI